MAAPKYFSQEYGKAWTKLGIGDQTKTRPPRTDDVDYKALQSEYVKENGYNITVPGFEDVFKWKPNELKTKEEKQAEKQDNLNRIMSSPTSDWFKSYSSLMTTIDNIQDTSSLVFPALRMLVRWSPRIFSRFIPGAGWLLLGYDALQLTNELLRGFMNPMGAKRAVCEHVRNNPFAKQAQRKRMERIAAWNPKFSDLLQGLQVTADTTGVGLSLGAVMGFIPDLAFGLYRKLTGDPVHFNADMPDFKAHELKAAIGMRNAALLNSAGQVFSEEMHLGAYLTFAASEYFLAPVIEEFDIPGICEDPQTAIIQAPAPTDPDTIEVIQKAGLSVEDGIRWPGSLEKEQSLLDLSDFILERSRRTFWDFSQRNSHSWSGYLAAHLMDQAVDDLIDAAEPGSMMFEENTPMILVMLTMLKTPLLPEPLPSKETWSIFEAWVRTFFEQNERPPNAPDITAQWREQGILWNPNPFGILSA
jgi:hypothetical protein